jgi:hypothetical protein
MLVACWSGKLGPRSRGTQLFGSRIRHHHADRRPILPGSARFRSIHLDGRLDAPFGIGTRSDIAVHFASQFELLPRELVVSLAAVFVEGTMELVPR